MSFFDVEKNEIFHIRQGVKNLHTNFGFDSASERTRDLMGKMSVDQLNEIDEIRFSAVPYTADELANYISPYH